MEIQLNGKGRCLQNGKTLQELLHDLAVDPKQVVVERNRQIVRRAQLSQTLLEEGDVLEILHFVGGG